MNGRPKGLLLIVLAWLTFSLPAASQEPLASAKPSGVFTIKGTLVDHSTGRPLNRAIVTITHTPQGERSADCATGNDGTFVFNNVPAGKYNLAAQARGYAPQAFRENDGYSTGIAVGPGLDSEHIVFPLMAAGSISGSIVDEEGDPVSQGQIWLFLKSVSSGKSEITMRGAQQPDSSGSFHFGHLGPGTYFIGVQARPWYAQNSGGMQVGSINGQIKGQESPLPSDLDVVYPTTYYPDAVDATAASPITVTEGSSANIQITLRAVPAVHLQLSVPELKPDTNMSANAFQIGPGGYQLSGGGFGVNSSNNQWELAGFAPGHYVVALQTFAQGHAETLGTRVIDLTGSTTLDISRVSKSSVSGQIAFQGSERPSGQIQVVFIGSGRGQSFQAVVEANGSFTLKDNVILPGRYGIQLGNAQGFYLKSIDVKGAKFSAGELEIGDGASVQLSLVGASGSTALKGLALKDEKPFPGAMVLLLPQNLDRTDLIRRDQSDSDGTFALNDVAPGRYTLVAIDDGRDLEYAKPSVIQPYLSEGRPINVPVQGASEPLQVRVASRRH